MHVSKITATNVKGRSFAHELEPVTLIHGPNYSGKTAVATALRLGLSGFLPPPIGKQAGSIYSAVAGDPDSPGEISVKVDCQDRSFLARWLRGSTGSCSMKGGVPEVLAMPAVLVEPRTFFALSGPARVQAIFEACEVKLTTESVVAAIRSAAPGAFPESRRKSLIAEFSVRATTLLKAKSPQVALADLVEEAKTRKLEAARLVKENAAVVEAIKWEGEIPEDVGDALDEARRRFADLIKQISDAQNNTRLIDASKRKLAEATRKIEELKAEIAITRWNSEPVAPDTSELEPLQDKIRRCLHDANENKRRKEAARAQVSELESGTCPTCGACGDSVRAAAKRILDAVELLPEESPASMFAMSAKVADLVRERVRHEKQSRDWSSDSAFCSSAETQIATLCGLISDPLPDPPNAELVSAMIEERERTSMAIALLSDHAAQRAAYLNTEEKRRAAEADAVNLTCDETVAADLVRVLRDLISSTVDVAFKKTLEVTHAFTRGILNSPLEYRDELGRRVSKADKDAGCKAPIGAWISHESFSGTEEAIAYAAFSVAVAMRAPLKVVIIDELGRMSTNVKRMALERMVELVSSRVIDQFVGVDTEPTEIDGVLLVDASKDTSGF